MDETTATPAAAPLGPLGCLAAQPPRIRQLRRKYSTRYSRNQVCPCGSGLKVKHCHGGLASDPGVRR